MLECNGEAPRISRINLSQGLNILSQLRWARVPCLRNLQKVNKCPHQCLKVVKFSGFVGSSIDTELAMYFTENAVALETFLVDLRKVVVEESTLLSEFVAIQKQLRAARKRALQMGKKLPPGTELIVLFLNELETK
ncbi:hypothetical protein Prudu_004218 [Prunus dulcis]|uniref:FBD domain-containing protein n=1 Tax=Prunus dulcis TaxID=3755 RepID=A0A4Y1QUT0_PRUDU|nr:hypothetical protein Prudu_004218 [Prunus dulcis]